MLRIIRVKSIPSIRALCIVEPTFGGKRPDQSPLHKQLHADHLPTNQFI